MMKILVLTDGKAGHENQTLAIARALGYEADKVRISFRNRFCKMLSYIADFFGIRTLGCLYRDFPALDGCGGRYAAVAGAGSGVFYALKVVSAKTGVKSIAVLYPGGYALSSFGCILAPSFDNPPRRDNVVELEANPAPADGAFYADAVKDFKARHALSDAKKVAVVIGGPNAYSDMTPGWAEDALERVFSENAGAEFWVTTSRRTPPEVERAVDSRPWDYKLIYSRDKYNPIPAFIMLADTVYVTAESTGMLSEACSRGTSTVRALDNLRPGRHKFRRFLDSLRAKGYVDGSMKIDISRKIEIVKRILSL